MLYLMVFATLGFSALFYQAMGARRALVSFTVFFVFAAYAFFNDQLFRSTPGALTERWMFYAWCFAQGPVMAYGFLVFMLLVGGIQLALSSALGSAEAYRLLFGLIYADLPASGQWWRLLSAPLVHDSMAHWATNALIGTGVMLIYGPVLGGGALASIVLAAPSSFALVLAASEVIAFDGKGIIGISGGIAGLMGCMLVANLCHPERFPRNFAVVTGFVAASSLFTVSLVLGSASLIAHLGGFLIGVVFGWIADPVSDRFHASPERD